jgi:hypothetical protein
MGGRLGVLLTSVLGDVAGIFGSDNTRDLVGRPPFAGRDHNQKLHDGVIDIGTARLHDEDIFFSNAS